MRPNSIRFKSLCFLMVYVLLVLSVLAPSSAYAVYDGKRGVSFDNGKNKCDTTDNDQYLAFDPYGGNIDYEFDFSNPTCLEIAAGVGAAAVTAWGAVKLGCRLAATCPTNNPASLAEQTEDAVTGPLTPNPSPSWVIKLGIWAKACTARTSAMTVCCSGGPLTCAAGTGDMIACCSGLAAFTAAISAALIALAVVHGKGNQAYANARICGNGWNTWKQLDSNGNTSSDGIWTKTKGPYQQCLRNLFLGESNTDAKGCGNDSSAKITNKVYREYIYGGMEFEDTDAGGCTNPSTWKDGRDNTILGYTSNNQRYYMTGAGSAPVYACYRFLAAAKEGNGYSADEDQAAMQEAYDCCKKRSQSAICIENVKGSKDVRGVVTGGPANLSDDVELVTCEMGTANCYDSYVTLLKKYDDVSSKFCEIGSTNCHVGDVDFEIYASTKAVNYVCAKTYSVCPYNHLLGGGTEVADIDDDRNIKNYCQYLKHCSKLPLLPYVRTSSLTGSYIDSSCQDLKGDTQNVYGYTAELLPINNRGFAAPIVQCFKETMENVFLNKAGYTKCADPDEVPNQNGNCVSGEEFQMGQELVGDSFFVKIQKRFQTLIKLVLTISIIFYGVMILFAVTPIERKSLFPYILKIALVAYFTLGNAWQAVFIENVLDASGYLAAITFKPDDPDAKTNKKDGCQFPRYNYADDNDSTKYTNPAYPPGKEYVQVWDILDCKIARALGFGPEISVPNLIFMILGGFLTAGLGLIFVIAAFCFAFFMIFVTIRALQFFLVSITAVIILLYVSTFIIPLSLFQKTKGIFDGWWKQMLSFTLQPMILFAYLGVLIAIFDNIVIGSATFSGTGNAMPKTISCDGAAKDDSIYCIFRVADMKNFTGLEALGIGLPMLTSMNAAKLNTIIKCALIMFIFSKFMDKINEVAATLTGGKEITTNWAENFKPSDMAKKAHGALKAVQNRGMNAIRKHAGTVLRKGMEGVKGLTNIVGNKGKRTPAAAGVIHTTSSKADSEVAAHTTSSKADSEVAAHTTSSKTTPTTTKEEDASNTTKANTEPGNDT